MNDHEIKFKHLDPTLRTAAIGGLVVMTTYVLAGIYGCLFIWGLV